MGVVRGGGMLRGFTSIFITGGSQKDCCVNKQHSSQHSGPRCCSRESAASFQGEQTGLTENLSSQRDLWRSTLYWQQKAWQDCALLREAMQLVSSLQRALLLSLGKPLEARAHSAHITLQINSISYLFHKHTLLVYVLLRFLKFRLLAQECN